ncbi:hypothetical protein QJQ45_014764, partial [Haematococcus lacustris]
VVYNAVNLSIHPQMCKEAQAQEKQDCAAACMQAIVDLALEKPCDLQPPLPCLEEVLDSQAECEAARLVVRGMYEGDVADEAKDPETLARMCRVAERWACSSLTSTFLLKLAGLPPSQLPARQLVLVLQTLPDSCALLPEHEKWQERVHSLVLSHYGDVHAVITSTQLRDYFQQLPFAAVEQWAGSDELTVDSENSVVELLSLWVAGPRGQACSVKQKQRLSCLVRVQHLSPGFAQGRLPRLLWFNVPGAPTAGVALAATCGFGLAGVLPKALPVWSAPPRKELCHDELLRRTTIRWDVPRQQLVALLASKDWTARVYSEPVYSAGTGWRVFITLVEGEHGNDGQPGFTLACYGELVPYAQCKDHALGAESPLGASGSGQRDLDGQEVAGQRRQVIKAVEAARPDLGPGQVDAVVAEINKRMTMGSKQCCLAAVNAPRSAAASAQLPPSAAQHLGQIKDAMALLAVARVQEHLMRGAAHPRGIKLLPDEVAVVEEAELPTAAAQQLLKECQIREEWRTAREAALLQQVQGLAFLPTAPAAALAWSCQGVAAQPAPGASKAGGLQAGAEEQLWPAGAVAAAVTIQAWVRGWLQRRSGAQWWRVGSAGLRWRRAQGRAWSSHAQFMARTYGVQEQLLAVVLEEEEAEQRARAELAADARRHESAWSQWLDTQTAVAMAQQLPKGWIPHPHPETGSICFLDTRSGALHAHPPAMLQLQQFAAQQRQATDAAQSARRQHLHHQLQRLRLRAAQEQQRLLAVLHLELVQQLGLTEPCRGIDADQAGRGECTLAPTSRLCIKNIPKYLSEAQLKQHFAAKGDVTDVKIMRTRDGVSRQLAFIGYSTEEQAAAAAKYFHKTFIDATRIEVEFARKYQDPALARPWSKHSAGSSAHARQTSASPAIALEVPAGKSVKSSKPSKAVGPQLVNGSAEEAAVRALRLKKKLAGGAAPGGAAEAEEAEGGEGSRAARLAEFMALMAPRSRSRLWSNDEVAPQQSLADLQRSKPPKPSKASVLAKTPDAGKLRSAAGLEDSAAGSDPASSSRSDTKQLGGDVGGAGGTPLLVPQDPAALIADTARLFVRNLAFTAREADLAELFGAHGDVSGVHLVQDKSTKKSRGVAYVQFVMPDDALSAWRALDGSIFQGRLLHILPSQPAPNAGATGARDGGARVELGPGAVGQQQQQQAGEGGGEAGGGVEAGQRGRSKEGSSFKAAQAEKRKDQAGNRAAWNSLFMRPDTVVEAVAAHYGVPKSQLMDARQSGDLAVRVALGEAAVIAATKAALAEEGVSVEALEAAAAAAGAAAGQRTGVARSPNVLLVKNLPFSITEEEVRALFSRSGPLSRVVLPPSHTLALVEFCEPQDARAAFKALAYKKLHHVPLYLEWAPRDIFTQSASTKSSTAQPAPGTKAATQAAARAPIGAKAVQAEQGLAPPAQAAGTAAKATGKQATGAAAGQKGRQPAAAVSAAAAADQGVPQGAVADGEEEEEAVASIYVKNLAFSTTDQALRDHFDKAVSALGGRLRSARVARRTPGPGQPGAGLSLSAGYGFVELDSAAIAAAVVQKLQGSLLDSHKLSLQLSRKRAVAPSGSKAAAGRAAGGAGAAAAGLEPEGTAGGAQQPALAKLVVRNVAFEATRKDIEGLFSPFGHLKSCRLPKKFDGSHRGFAFVEMTTKQEARNAMDGVTGTHLYGRRLVVEYAKAEAGLDELRAAAAHGLQEQLDTQPRGAKRLRKGLLRLLVPLRLELVGEVCGAAVLTDWASRHFAVPCYAQDTGASHRLRGHIMFRRYLVLEEEEEDYSAAGVRKPDASAQGSFADGFGDEAASSVVPFLHEWQGLAAAREQRCVFSKGISAFVADDARVGPDLVELGRDGAVDDEGGDVRQDVVVSMIDEGHR